MPRPAPPLVWYVSYGSNLHRQRFLSYLEGGLMPGGLRADPGCRDTAPPLDDAPLHLSFGLYFSGESRVWGGGIAFLDHEPVRPDCTFARSYLITREQFEDLVAQESKRATTAVAWDDLLANGGAHIGPGRYDALVVVGDRDGIPMVTFTHPRPMADVELARPVAGYLRMLAIGLRDCHRLTDDEIAAYLVARPGIAGEWSRAELLEALRA